MPLIPRFQELSPDFLKHVRLVASDMDGTLTHHGQFTPALLQALAALAESGISVLIVTGRSAGWVQGLVNYLPIAGAIAENGGVYYANGAAVPEALVAIPNTSEHRHRLKQTFHLLQADFPQLQETADNSFRLTDWTFDVQGLSSIDLQQLNDRCQTLGWGFTYSTVQCHIKRVEQDKAPGLLQVLARHFPDCVPAQVLTVGDSPNDESLFDADRFPYSVGVANLRDYADNLTHLPTYITQAAEVTGFCELARSVLAAREEGR
jgi:hypothetical protein